MRTYTIIRERDQREVERVVSSGNEAFLRRTYPAFRHLADLDDYAPVSLGSQLMPELVDELERIRVELTSDADRGHIDQVLRLAAACAREGGCLVFAPYARPFAPDAGSGSS